MSEDCAIKHIFKHVLSRCPITCITFVPAAHGLPPCLLVNAADSTVSVVDCLYDNDVRSFAVQLRMRVVHRLLSGKSCYSPSGQGFLISGSVESEVCVYSLARNRNTGGPHFGQQRLQHRSAPVIAVATNQQDTLLASADAS